MTKPPITPRSLWITIEAADVIELKRISMDHDGNGAVVFFREIITPRVRAAARQRGIAVEILTEDEINEPIPG